MSANQSLRTNGPFFFNCHVSVCPTGGRLTLQSHRSDCFCLGPSFYLYVMTFYRQFLPDSHGMDGVLKIVMT